MSATKRLQRDLCEWRECSPGRFGTVAAEPLERNLFEWHFNVFFSGHAPLHGRIRFPRNYPFEAPEVDLFGPFPHDQVVFNRKNGLYRVCLDILSYTNSDGGYYSGWSSAYSATSVLAQMSLLWAEFEAGDAAESWAEFRCDCGHDGSEPSGHWPVLIENADTTARTSAFPLECYHSRVNFFDFCATTRETSTPDEIWRNVFGLGMEAQYWAGSRRSRLGARTGLKEVSVSPDVLSYGAYRDGVRSSIFGQDRFSEFLPLYVNEDHGRFATAMAEAAIQRMCKSGDFDASMAVTFLTNVMNGTVVSLVHELEENKSDDIPTRRWIAAVQTYKDMHHLLLGFAALHPALTIHAMERVQAFVRCRERRERSIEDLGELMICLAMSGDWDASWKTIGPMLLKEEYVRDTKWILKANPSLICVDGNGQLSCVRLHESWEATKHRKRLLMFQVWFLRRVCGFADGGTHDLETQLERCNACLGRVSEELVSCLERDGVRMSQVDGWMQFYRWMGLPCPSGRRLSHDFRLSMLESDANGYQRYAMMETDARRHEDPDLCVCGMESCEYRVKKWKVTAAKARYDYFGIPYDNEFVPIRARKYSVGRDIEYTDFETHRVFPGTVVSVELDKYCVTVNVPNCRDLTTACPLASLRVRKRGRVLTTRNAMEHEFGVLDPSLPEDFLVELARKAARAPRRRRLVSTTTSCDWRSVFGAVHDGDIDSLKGYLAHSEWKVVEATDSVGRTLLHFAARSGSMDMVRMLLAAGANPLVKDCNGETALDVATALVNEDGNDWSSVVSLLKSRMKRRRAEEKPESETPSVATTTSSGNDNWCRLRVRNLVNTCTKAMLLDLLSSFGVEISPTEKRFNLRSSSKWTEIRVEITDGLGVAVERLNGHMFCGSRLEAEVARRPRRRGEEEERSRKVSRGLFVNGFGTTDESVARTQISKLFGAYGDFGRRPFVKLDKKGQLFAFVTMENTSAAVMAQSGLDGVFVHGRHLRVMFKRQDERGNKSDSVVSGRTETSDRRARGRGKRAGNRR